MFNEPKFSLIAGIAALAFTFGIQILLCFKARKVGVKLIPIYLLFLCIAFCVALSLGMFGTGSGVIANTNKLAALIVSIPVTFACIGDVLAWVLYARIQKRKQ
jgi:hypothetical protein